MWIFTASILGGILLVALILGSLGVLCTREGYDLVPGLLFGLPAVLLSLLVCVFFIEVRLFWAGIFTAPPLIIGALVIWRGFRTGQRRGDYLSAGLVCVGIFLMGFALIRCPEITDAIFSRLLPPAPIL
jgi:hypothetical protein